MTPKKLPPVPPPVPDTVKKPDATLPPPLYAKGTWLRERDGDLNPTWIFVTAYIALGAAGCIVALQTKSVPAIIAALSFLTTNNLALLMSALPISKAKVLSRARLSQAVATGENPPDATTKPGVD